MTTADVEIQKRKKQLELLKLQEEEAALEELESSDDYALRYMKEQKGYKGPAYVLGTKAGEAFPFVGSWMPKIEGGIRSYLSRMGVKDAGYPDTGREIEYQQYKTRRMEEDSPVQSALGKLLGISVSPSSKIKAIERLGFLPRLASSTGLAALEGYLDDPDYFRNEETVGTDSELRKEQALQSALWSARLGFLGGAAQQFLGSRGTENIMKVGSLGPTPREADAVERTMRGGKNRVADILEEENVFSQGLLPFYLPATDKRMAKRVNSAMKKYESIRDALEEEATGAKISSLDVYQDIADELSKKRLSSSWVTPEQDYEKIQNQLDSLRFLSDLDVKEARKVRAAIQSRSNYNDPSYTALQQLFDEAKARSLNKRTDEAIEKVNRDISKKYAKNREKLHALSFAKNSLAGKEARATSSGLSGWGSALKTISSPLKIGVGKIIGSRGEQTIPSLIQKLNIQLPSVPIEESVFEYIKNINDEEVE